MADAFALDSGQSVSHLEFMQSLNGIDVFEDTSTTTTESTKLRSVCHIEADIGDFVRLIGASSSDGRLNGIVESHALGSLLQTPKLDIARSDRAIDERAAVVTFSVTSDSFRESGIVRRTTTAAEGEDDAPPIAFDALWYQGPFTHRSRRGWVQWSQSIELPGREDFGTRGSLLVSGIAAVESATRRGQLSVSFAMGVELGSHTLSERRVLEAAVWGRVMKLAGLRKTLERSSLARTVSVASTTSTGQPECEPVIGTQDQQEVDERKTPLKQCERMQQKHETTAIKASRGPGLPRSPSCLEFRLTYYKPPPDPIGSEFMTAMSTTQRPKSKSASVLR
ncbi:hypothetical protein PINS_up004492 [Pythium insidiosum]|nr:hypothetical protein PINS_up004492 [Pythium insidiosum]